MVKTYQFDLVNGNKEDVKAINLVQAICLMGAKGITEDKISDIHCKGPMSQSQSGR